VGGAGLVFTEATAVEARGRISPQDLGLWKDAQIDMLRRITAFIHGQGAVAGIQLAHAGRKASTSRPWEGNVPLDLKQGGWRPILSPSALPFHVGSPTPEAMSDGHIGEVTDAFAHSTRRALAAGFQVVEIHAAHGYLLHEFLSPLTNKRTDAYGGTFENRIRLLREVVAAVRDVWPEALPLFVRISVTYSFIATEKARTEPIAGRIIEVPEDEEQSEVVRNPRSGFVAYVPRVKKGKDIVAIAAYVASVPLTAGGAANVTNTN
jgi:2,4-dienoyl-CoA reductase-like NADH-dependent reductase (Old Yellow Enzyme family)